MRPCNPFFHITKVEIRHIFAEGTHFPTGGGDVLYSFMFIVISDALLDKVFIPLNH